MVSCVGSTAQTLSSVDDYIFEDDFCKFWSVSTCGLHFVYYTICWRKRFLDFGDTNVPNFEVICVDVWWDFFPNMRRSFTKFLNSVSPISTIDLIRLNINSGTTIESLFILCSFVDIMDLLVILLIMFWCQTQNYYRKYHYPYRVLLKEHFWLMIFLLTPQTLWWFWQCQGHKFPNESMMNHHVCWPNLLFYQLIWFPCCFAGALGQESFFRVLYLFFERKKKLFLKFLHTSGYLTCIVINSKICTVNHLA